MPSTDRKLELKAKTSMAQTTSQTAVYAKGLMTFTHTLLWYPWKAHKQQCVDNWRAFHVYVYGKYRYHFTVRSWLGRLITRIGKIVCICNCWTPLLFLYSSVLLFFDGCTERCVSSSKLHCLPIRVVGDTGLERIWKDSVMTRCCPDIHWRGVKIKLHEFRVPRLRLEPCTSWKQARRLASWISLQSSDTCLCVVAVDVRATRHVQAWASGVSVASVLGSLSLKLEELRNVGVVWQ
jgi:hypothetical protein